MPIAIANTITQADLGPMWRVGVKALDADGIETGAYVDLSASYTCTIAVPTASPAISRAVTGLNSDNTRFLAQLTPAETATIPVGSNSVYIEVNNATLTPVYNVEEKITLVVETEGIP